MRISKFLSTAVAAAALLAANVASASLVVTLNPQATNGGLGVVGADTAAFQTVGFQADLYTTLVIDGLAGNTTFTETGKVVITSFKNGAGTADALSGVGSDYSLFGNFTLTGVGAWAGNTYTAAPGASFTMDLYADPTAGTSPTIFLGQATLDTASPQVAFAMLFNGNAALTSLSAGLNFAPNVGTTGATGFFQQPTPFNIDLSIGNAGGNTLNTSYSISGGKVTVVNPSAGTNPGTANVTFVANQVSEPAGIALLGLGLVGAGLARRKAVKA